MKSKSVIASYMSRNKLQKILSVLFICILAITAINFTGAWFTDSAESSNPETVLTFGSIKIALHDSANSIEYDYVNAYIIRDADSNGTYEKITDSKKIIPGDELVVEMWVENVGTASCYYLANVSSESNILSPTFSGDYYFDSQSSNKTRLNESVAVKSSGGVGALGVADSNKKQEVRISTIINNGITSFSENDITISCSVSAIQSANISTSLAYACLRTMNNNNFISNYTQLEYIESTGTQYIDTGVNPTSNLSVDLSIQLTNYLGADKKFFGAYNGKDGICLGTYSSKWRVGGGTWGNKSIAVTNQHTRIQASTDTWIINGESCTSNNVISNYDSPISIFAINYKYVVNTNEMGSMKLYYLRLYSNDTLVRDYVPCIRNSDKEVGLYDLVNNKFYENQGTGDFVAGNELKNDLDYVLNYTAVEYIESTGTQYINTLFNADSNTSIEMSVAFSEISSNQTLWCARQDLSIKTFTLLKLGSLMRTDFGNEGAVYYNISGFTPNVNQIYTFAQDKNKIYIDNSLVYTHTQQTFSTNTHLFLGASHRNLSTLAHYGKYKTYSCKIWDNGTLVRDYVPCIRNSDGESGLYDRVNKEFYTNSGTGEFLAGPTL